MSSIQGFRVSRGEKCVVIYGNANVVTRPCTQREFVRLSEGQLNPYKKLRYMSVRSEASTKGTAPATLVDLGASGLKVSRVGVGTMSWGDPSAGYTPQLYPDTEFVFDRALRDGINFFDTAEVYGYQGIKNETSSEYLIGQFMKKAPPTSTRPVIGTKFFPVPWTNFLVGGGFRLGRQSVLDALKASLKRLDLDQVDLYQVHFPLPFFKDELLADVMAEAVDKGLAKAIGVCNYTSPAQLESFHALLAKKGIALASNQVKYSLVDREPEKSGLLKLCKDMNVALVAHSPLKRGLLTTKYVDDGGGAEGAKLRPLLKMMNLMCTLSGERRSVTQFALNYLIAKGAIPIPGAKNTLQLFDSIKCLDWSLDDNELGMLDEKATYMGL
eukprot:jgi/Botrbrau1/688/Bobra.160_2s0011.1